MNIGEDQEKEVIRIEPVPETPAIPEPSPTPVPTEPAREPEKVPA